MKEIERFLIVDDNDANILFFQVLLDKLGKSDVTTASTVEDAWVMFESNRIQFVITAWEMDPTPGTVLVQRLRSNRKSRFVPILIFSKRMDEKDIQLTQDLGFDSVLGMPFDRDGATKLVEDMIRAEEEITPLEVKVRKIESFIEDNQPLEAKKLVNASVTKKSPFRARVKTAVGEMWIQIKQYKNAEVSLNEALDDTSDYLPAKYMLARLYSVTGRHEEAISLMEEASTNSPNNIATLINLGSAYVDAEDYENAQRVFDQADAIDKDSGELNDQKGKMAFKQGDLPLAAQLLSETKNGDFLAREFNNMAIAQVAQEDFPNAISTYESAIRILADKAKVHLLTFNMGLAYRKSGDLKNGFAKLCESYIMCPSFEKAYGSLVKLSKEIKAKGEKLDGSLVKRVKEARQSLADASESEGSPESKSA